MPANATPESYERRDTAVGMLASYYNAINREEYRRAYGYRESPQESFEEFAGGFDDTATVLPIVQVPPYPGAAAGNRYAAIPTLLLASQVDGNQQTFAGCFVAHRAAPEVAGHPTEWSLQSAQVDAQPSNRAGVSLLAGACESYERSTAAIVYDERSTPISLLASYYNAIEREEYRRAYDYWKQPAQSFQEFAQGFADTNTIQVYTALPGNAGARVSIPVLLQATEEDDSRHLYLGCFAMERTTSQPHTWSLYDATVAPTNTDNAMQIRQACM